MSPWRFSFRSASTRGHRWFLCLPVCPPLLFSVCTTSWGKQLGHHSVRTLVASTGQLQPGCGVIPWHTQTCGGQCTCPVRGSRARSSCTVWRPRGTSPGRKTHLPETGHCWALPASSSPGKIRRTGNGLCSHGRKQPLQRLDVAISS